MAERRTLVAASGVALAGALVGLWLHTAREPRPHHVVSESEHAGHPQVATPVVTEERTPEPLPAEPTTRAVLDSKPESENAYLHAVWELHDTDKPRALELVRKGDRWYSDRGVAAEARKAMAVTLLVDLGQMEAARAEVRQFITAYPDSRYLPMVEGVTGIHPRPTGPSDPP